jgi:hypothetical protein
VPIVESKPPVWEWRDPVPGVSLAYLPKDFPASFFMDDKHLNIAGYQYQSLFLKEKLRNQCWW